MNDATVRVESTFKNARLYNAIKERSICLAGADEIRLQALHRAGPIKAFCDLHDLSLQGVYLLLNLKRSPRFVGQLNKPMEKRGHFTPMARRLAELLDADPAWLFPDELYAAGLRKTVGHLTTQQFVALTSGHARKELQVDSPQTDTVLQRELSESLTKSLAMLSPRESRVLQLRTGIATGEEVTLDEVAKDFGVSRERIRQIEAKAYRKMRHPSRAGRLKPFLDALGTRRWVDPWRD